MNRQIVPFRHEFKHPISRMDYIELQRRLPNVMKHDSFCGQDGTYRIRSLYFDNPYDKAFFEKVDGINQREKFRIRFYNGDVRFMRLEKKSKINGLCAKQSVRISAEDCQKILQGDYEFLKQADHALLKEFYFKLTTQLLRPKNIVDYCREAYLYPAGNVRITVDLDIRGSMCCADFLQEELCSICVEPSIILEVKYDAYLPSVILDIIRLQNRKVSAFSKYAAARIF
ncbi:MAG TPA: polyphosphate polymerase domain-containing protein [Firmicutes bacterium]|nr:polyphosphate polymerase domain-containing protein [Bacillota bacterium]